MSAGARSEGTEVVKKILRGEPVQLFKGLDAFRVQDSLQLLRWNFLDKHEDSDLGQLYARDSVARPSMVIRHTFPLYLYGSKSFD